MANLGACYASRRNVATRLSKPGSEKLGDANEGTTYQRSCLIIPKPKLPGEAPLALDEHADRSHLPERLSTLNLRIANNASRLRSDVHRAVRRDGYQAPRPPEPNQCMNASLMVDPNPNHYDESDSNDDDVTSHHDDDEGLVNPKVGEG